MLVSLWQKINVEISNKHEVREKVNIKWAQGIVQRVKELGTSSRGMVNCTNTNFTRTSVDSNIDTFEINVTVWAPIGSSLAIAN